MCSLYLLCSYKPNSPARLERTYRSGTVDRTDAFHAMGKAYESKTQTENWLVPRLPSVRWATPRPGLCVTAWSTDNSTGYS